MSHQEDFQKRRNIGDIVDPVEEFHKMKNGFLICFDNSIEDFLSSDEVDEFHISVGILKDYVVSGYDYALSSITKTFLAAKDIRSFCLLVEQLSIATQSYARRNHYDSQESVAKEKLMKFITKVVPNRNLNIVFEVQNNPFRIMTYPKGEKLLDDELVNQPLGFLDPKSQKLFIEALKEYQNGKGYKSAEMLRKCIEEFLRFKLGNSKNWENNKVELLKAISSNGGNKYITNIIEGLLTKLEDCFNNISKHKTEEIFDQENEFLIYQVGSLLRYVDRQI